MTVHMGPGNSTTYNEQCLRRDMSPWLATQTLNATLTEWVMSADTYALYDFRLQGTGLAVSGMTIHAGGHMSGSCTILSSSPLARQACAV